MAPLAPIPEGSHAQSFSRFSQLNDLKNTSTNKHRPQSRVFVASRRHTRTRYQRPERTEHFAPVSATSPPHHASQRAPKSAFDKTNMTSETASDEHVDPSDSSFDLDSFPLPPSTSSTLSKHGSRPTTSSGSWASTTTNEKYINRYYRASKSRRYHTQFDGANDVSRSSNRASVDSALVDAITRNMIQQFRLSSVGRCRQNQAKPNATADRSR